MRISLALCLALAGGLGCRSQKPGHVGTLTGDLAFEALSGFVDESDAGAFDVFLQDRAGICSETAAAQSAMTLHFPAGKTGVIPIGEADPPGESFAVVWKRKGEVERFTPYPSSGGLVEVTRFTDAGLSARFDLAFNVPGAPAGSEPLRLSGQFEVARCGVPPAPAR